MRKLRLPHPGHRLGSSGLQPQGCVLCLPALLAMQSRGATFRQGIWGKLDTLEVGVTKSSRHTHQQDREKEVNAMAMEERAWKGQTLLCPWALGVCSVTQPPRPWPQASSVSAQISRGPQLTTRPHPLVTVPVFRQQGRGHQSWPRTQHSHPPTPPARPWSPEVGAG